MKVVKLGSQGLQVPQLGLGCMSMTGLFDGDMYGKADEQEAIETIHRSFELGGNFLDTADQYGPFINEQLIRKAIGNNRSKYIISTKFGIELDDSGKTNWKVNGQRAYVRKSIDRSLKNLGTDYVDLYYLHRLDKNTPIEETVDAMADLVKEGKVRYIGLSEVSSATIRKAHQVHPLTAVESEYSLFERTVEQKGILDTLNELGIGFVAYAPLGRGFLSGKFRSPDDFPENDFRRTIPRFQGEQFYKNIELLDAITAMAKEKEITSAQLALAWVNAKGHVPIPGTRQRKNLELNIASAGVNLSAADLEKLENIIPLGLETGNSYDEFGMALNDY